MKNRSLELGIFIPHKRQFRVYKIDAYDNSWGVGIWLWYLGFYFKIIGIHQYEEEDY